MKQEQREALVSVLAAIDAVFIPERNPGAADARWRIAARLEYLAGRGVVWTAARAGFARRTDQRQAERIIDGLIAMGLVIRKRRDALRLTERGDDEARALAGLFVLRDSVELLQQLIDHRTDSRGGDFLERCWMPETAYAGVEWGDNKNRGKLVKLEERALPLLVRGLIESNATPVGHVYYAPSPKAIRWSPPANWETIESAHDAEQRERYYNQVKTGLASMATAGNPPRDIGQIPMPMSFAPRGAAPGGSRNAGKG